MNFKAKTNLNFNMLPTLARYSKFLLAELLDLGEVVLCLSKHRILSQTASHLQPETSQEIIIYVTYMYMCSWTKTMPRKRIQMCMTYTIQ